MPPDAVLVAVPSDAPHAEGSMPVAITVGFEALPTVAIVVFRQLAPSITMTV